MLSLTLVFLFFSAVSAQSTDFVSGCKSLYTIGKDLKVGNATCLCDVSRFSYNRSLISCLYDVSALNVANATELAKKAKKSVHEINLKYQEKLTNSFFNGIKLTDLWIDYCNPAKPFDIPTNAFKGVEKTLTNMTITKCKFKSFPRAIAGLPDLQLLYLSDNGLTKIGRWDFALMKKLRTLELANNKIEAVDENSFKSQKKLELLSITAFAPEIKKTIFKAIKHVPTIKKLFLGDGDLETIPEGAFDHFKNLKELHLPSIRLEKITKNMFKGLSNLEHLILPGNLIDTVEVGSFSHLKNLKTINFAGNYFDKINPEVFKGLNKLYQLDLSGNEFETLPASAFKELKNLQILDLWHILPMKKIHKDAFTGLANLKRLNLAQSEFKTFDASSFKPLKNLEVLDLSFSKVDEVPIEIFTLAPKLKRLELRQTKVTVKKMTALCKGVKKLQIIDIYGRDICTK